MMSGVWVLLLLLTVDALNELFGRLAGVEDPEKGGKLLR
jgi:hypothetical protein